MSPMMRSIFPFIMVVLVMVSVTTLNGELSVKKEMEVVEMEWKN